MSKKSNPGTGRFERCVKDVSRRGDVDDPKAVCASSLAGKYGRTHGRVNASDFDLCVKDVTRRGGARDPRAVCGAAGREKYGQAEMTRRSVAGRRKHQPADEAKAVFEEFHGYAPTEVVTVERQVHVHQHLAAAGKLVGLDVWGVDGRGHELRRFRGAILAFNEKKNQLFIEGGDQRVNLQDFGITRPHEVETLGQVVDIDYHARKDHLGEEGGTAVYVHRFTTTNENGRHITVNVARYPDLIYRVVDEQLEFSGGSYFIRAEGIDQ